MPKAEKPLALTTVHATGILYQHGLIEEDEAVARLQNRDLSEKQAQLLLESAYARWEPEIVSRRKEQAEAVGELLEEGTIDSRQAFEAFRALGFDLAESTVLLSYYSL